MGAIAMPEDKPDTGEPDAPEDKPEPKPDTDWEKETAKWKALARKHEEQAKANASAAKKLSELEDADKTESQKLQERIAAAEKRAEEAELKAVRAEVAAEKGLTAAQARRLVGSTKEELTADADELLADFTPTGNGDDRERPATRPRENLRGGGDPTEEPDETDPRKLAEHVGRSGRGY